jgi:hypothetical protein
MSSSPGYEKEKEREGKERDSREDEVRNGNESEVCIEGKGGWIRVLINQLSFLIASSLTFLLFVLTIV